MQLPRTVRANWTQLEMPMEKISTQMAKSPRPTLSSRPRTTPSMSSAMRMAGKGELDVGDAHDEGVDQATAVAGDQAQGDAEDHGEDDAGEADQQRDAGAEDDRR